MEVSDIQVKLLEREIYESCYYEALFDITQECNAVWKSIMIEYMSTDSFLKDFNKNIPGVDRAALAEVLRIHGKNMISLSSALERNLSLADKATRADIIQKREREFSSSGAKPIIIQYLRAFTDSVVARLE